VSLPYVIWSSASSTAGLASHGSVGPVKQGQQGHPAQRRDADLESSTATTAPARIDEEAERPSAPWPVVVPTGSLEYA
jgi:hypothetical protein